MHAHARTHVARVYNVSVQMDSGLSRRLYRKLMIGMHLHGTRSRNGSSAKIDVCRHARIFESSCGINSVHAIYESDTVCRSFQTLRVIYQCSRNLNKLISLLIVKFRPF